MSKRVTVLALVESSERVDKPELVPSRDEMLLDLSDYALCWGADIIELFADAEAATGGAAGLMERVADLMHWRVNSNLDPDVIVLRAAAEALKGGG